ncbi:MAG: hypothetical protein GC179_28640 [Anaerolineaceae bacterium]|nr:hypothetical protein [Anaerolineaceae bacterium]
MKRRFTLLLMAITSLFVMPAWAQDSKPTLATIQYNGISFSYDPSLGAVLAQTFAEVPATSDSMVDEYWPAHVSFSFINATEGDTLINPNYYPQLNIYKVADITAYNNELYTTALQSLKGLIEAGGAGDFSHYEQVTADDANLNLPHLPPVPAGQVMRAQAEYLPVTDGMGIRYLTAYASDVSPLTDDSIVYTYQGATNQFKGDKPGYYIAFSYPIKTGVLPAEISNDFDYNAFSNNYIQEMNKAIQKINAADPNTFSPTLAALDALVQSIKIEG